MVGVPTLLQCVVTNNTASTKAVVVGMSGGEAFALAGPQACQVAVLPASSTTLRCGLECAGRNEGYAGVVWSGVVLCEVVWCAVLCGVQCCVVCSVVWCCVLRSVLC